MNITEFRVDRPASIDMVGNLSFDAKQRIDEFVAKNRAMQLKQGSPGLNDIAARQIAEYIEKNLFDHVRARTYYLRRELTGLPNTVEYDPISKKVFIHLKTHWGVALIGEGGQKRITKTVEYGLNPETYANAVYSCKEDYLIDDAKIEKDTIEKLQGKKGIIEVVSTSEHRSKDGRIPKIQIITKLYNRGSLERFLESGEKLSLKQKKALAEDILEGCLSMHKQNIIHRDIKPENVFIERQDSGNYRAVIADFGLAKDVRSDSILSLAHGTPSYIPPFAGKPEQLHQEDKKRVDLFPIANTLVTLFTKKRILWTKEKPKANNKELAKVVKMVKKESRSKKNSKPKRKISKVIAAMLKTGKIGKIKKKAEKNVETYLNKFKKIRVK